MPIVLFHELTRTLLRACCPQFNDEQLRERVAIYGCTQQVMFSLQNSHWPQPGRHRNHSRASSANDVSPNSTL